MTFPIKKRINTELFIDIMAALYTVEHGKGGQPLVLVNPQIK